MKQSVITGLFLLLSFLGFPQGEWNNWYFGWYAAMKFVSGTPVGITGSALTQSAGGTTTTVSDSAGNLLFYANGLNIWNRNNVVMPNGSGLIGGNICQQPVFSAPVPGFPNRYYVFMVGDPVNGNNTLIGFHYSIVDMSLQGGLGDVISTQKNIYVPGGDSAVDQLTGTRSQNNKDIWIVVRKHNPVTHYLAYRVDASGLNTTPVVSPTTMNARLRWQLGHLTFSRGGDMKISYDGKFLVCHDSLTEICRFNDTTGVVTPLFKVLIDGNMSGVEFSSDSKYLYVCTQGGQGNQNQYHAYQFDLGYLDSLSFMQHKVLIGVGAGSKLQMGPNWKIYEGANPFIDSLNCINNPSLPGLACNYQRNAVSLAGNINAQDLVQFLQRYKAYINFNGNCSGTSLHFLSDIWPPADSIHWDFGDPVSGPLNFSNLPAPSHIYSNAGIYTVELFVRHIDNRTDTAWQTITIVASPQVALGADRTVCTGDSVTFDAGACSGCTYLWKDLGTGLPVGSNQTFKTGLAGNYSVIVTNPAGCTGADTVQLNTTAVPSVTNSPLSKTICSGESTNIALTSTVPGTNFHWTASLTSGNIIGFSADSGLVINQVLTNLMPTPGIVTYHITPKIGSCIGATVDFTVTVIPGDSVKISIAASANNVCASTPVTFTATPVNGGTNPAYQWKVNSFNTGTDSSIFTYTPNNGDVVQCILTSSNTICISNNPATSNTITMIVNLNLPVSVSVGATQNPVCAGTSVTFTATPDHGGSSPQYQWKVNGGNVGTNNSNYSYTPNNGDTISCTLTSSEICTTGNPAISNQIIMTVNPKLPVSISIAASSNPFCIGNSVTFTATHANGGSSPSYQWKVNGANLSIDTLYTYYPVNGDLVSCVFTSSASCITGNPATSNTITMTGTTGLPAGVSINAVPNPFCPGSSVTCTATPGNGGTNPVYQWKVNGVNVGINSPTYTFNPLNNDSVRCVMTSNLSCVSGNPATSNKIILSGTLAPIVTFTRCFDSITTLNAKPIKLKGGIPLGGTYSGPGVNSVTGVFTPLVAGIGTKTITYTYTNIALCSASKTKIIIVQSAPAFTCGNNFTDIRDGKIYPTLQIASQCWLAENLNYGTMIFSSTHQRDNCVPEKYCYNDLTANCQLGTATYQWDEVMQYQEAPGIQGLCPPGWHVPTETDWNTLFSNWTNNAFAGAPLKYSGYSGFNALLSGVRHLNVQWDYQNVATFFWSSTSYGALKAWSHGMNDYDPSVSLYPSSRANGFSVRCLKD